MQFTVSGAVPGAVSREGPRLRPTAHGGAQQASERTRQARVRVAGLGGDQGLQPQRAAAAPAPSLPVGRQLCGPTVLMLPVGFWGGQKSRFY